MTRRPGNSDATAQPTHLAADADLAGAIDRLAHEFAGTFAPETVRATVEDSHARLGHARITQYQPLLAYRFARERLKATAKATATAAGLAAGSTPEVLFVCTRNSARSQLAAALLAHRAKGRVTVRSAGTAPAAEVDPGVVAALAGAGIPEADLFPKPLVDESVAAADVVVTMGCGDACPVLPGRRYLDWELPEHAEPSVVLDLLVPRVDALLADLLATNPLEENPTR